MGLEGEGGDLSLWRGESQSLDLGVQGWAWVSGSQKFLIPNRPVQGLSSAAKPQLIPSCSQGLYPSLWKLSGQCPPIREAWTGVTEHLSCW